MRALIIEDVKKLAVVERPEPQKGDAVIIKVAYCGICGSDVSFWDRGLFKGLVPGHEFSGTVVHPGNSQSLKAGDRVTAIEISPCYECRTCQEGFFNNCPSTMKQSPGITWDGGMAEYVAVRSDMVRKLPDEVNDIAGALIEPTAVSLHNVRWAGVGPGSRVLITGAGPIGLLAAACAKALGAAFVAITELKERLAFPQAATYVDEVFNATDPELAPKLLAAAGGYGFDQAIDSVGAPQTLETCIGALKPGGKLALIGVKDKSTAIPVNLLQAKGLTVFGDLFFLPADFDLVIELMRTGMLKIEECASVIIPLSEAQHYFGQLNTGRGTAVKVLCDPRL
jgi:L-iditol 2-dehydrogenase